MKKFVAAFALAAAAGFAVAPAQAVVIGTNKVESSMPFGSSLGGYYYQQVYSAASLGSLSISDLTFYASAIPGSTGQARTGTFVAYLSTTTAAITNYDTAFMQYPDASFTEVFNGTLPAIVDGALTLNLASAFTYDATLGNLVLTIREFSLSSFGAGTVYLQADNKSTAMNSRFSAYSYDWDSSRTNYGQGLVTGFNVAAAAVPEPATWAMMAVGFGVVGAGLRRRKVSVRFA
jgi:hypothetical protein